MKHKSGFVTDQLRGYDIGGSRRVYCSGIPLASDAAFTDFVISDEFRFGPGNDIVSLILRALQGEWFCIGGEVKRLIPFMRELHYGILTLFIDNDEKINLACHFAVHFRRRLVVNVKSEDVQDFPLILPDVISDALRYSDSVDCYLPIFLLVDVSVNMYGPDLAGLDFIDWSNERIKRTAVSHFDPIMGIELHVEAGVFIPDRLIGELFVQAALRPNSELLRDLRDGIVLEPCSGSGYLGFIALCLGARMVVSSDADFRSVLNAKKNAERLGCAGNIVHLCADGLPVSSRSYASIVFNPPWIDAESADGWGQDKKRCMVDIGHRLLYRIINQAAFHLHFGSGLWFVLGAKSRDVGESVNVPYADCAFAKSLCIEGRRGMRLFRYEKIRL